MLDISNLEELLDQSGKFGLFTPLNINKSPSETGLYAWYALPDIGASDWEYEIVDGQDVGITRFRQLLDRHTAKFKSPPLSVLASGSFSRAYEGELEEANYGNVESALENESENSSEALRKTMGSPELREVSVTLINTAAIFFSGPLYVGVAADLNDRLSGHVSQLNRFHEAVRGDPDKRARLLGAKKSTFASRAIGMGFTIDNLYALTLSAEMIDDSGLSQERLRTVSEAVEWLLNRWARPILGRM